MPKELTAIISVVNMSRGHIGLLGADPSRPYQLCHCVTAERGT